MAQQNILIYYLRHDLRVADNPILHHLTTTADHGVTHLLPIYVLHAHQIEVSGFTREGETCPYPEARSALGKYWRCGPHRAKFLAQALWNLRSNLESAGSGLWIVPGKPGDVVDHILQHFGQEKKTVGAIWMVGEDGVEEGRDEEEILATCNKHGVECKIWQDEKYFIDDRDLDLKSPDDLADVFTTYRKAQEPLKTRPRVPVPRPEAKSLPPLPKLPPPLASFETPMSYADLVARLLKPLSDVLTDMPDFPEKATSAYPLKGGEDAGHERLHHVVKSGIAAQYKDSRNGLVGDGYSTKLSAYLALGCLTARQVHERLAGYEDGTDDEFRDVDGFGGGENQGTSAIRFELLWRDYMRLCSRRFKTKLFRLKGLWDTEKGGCSRKWKTADPARADADQNPSPKEVEVILQRFRRGTTGFGLLDASMRELLHTGYTSNRARQNVASFLTRRLGIDWRYGAEWYEMLLVDYDVSSNWANWQYVAGIGNDPKETRVFNPVKQAFEYDPNGDYVRMWVPELAGLENLENLFQASTTSPEEVQRLGLTGLDMVERPVERITYYVDRKPPKRGGRYYFRGPRGGGAPQGESQGGGLRAGGGAGNSNSNNNNGGASPTGSSQGPPSGAPRGPSTHSRPSSRGGRGRGEHTDHTSATRNMSRNGTNPVVIDPNTGGARSRGFRGAGNRVYRGSRRSFRGGFAGRQYPQPLGGGAGGSAVGTVSAYPYYSGQTQLLPAQMPHGFPNVSNPIGPHWVIPHPEPHM